MKNNLREMLFGKTAGNVALLILVVLGGYFFAYREARFFRIPSSSMEPTLYPVDQIVTMSESKYTRGSIVVLREPKSAGEYFVKRIVGIAGDRIEVHRGALFLNGEYASEPYLAEPMQYEILKAAVVPEGQVFVLGDNRNNSADSHDALETFSTDIIVGRVRFIYYPYERFGTVATYPLTNSLGQ